MSDAVVNSVYVQLGSLGVLGVGLLWIAKWLIPRALALVEKMIADHKEALDEIGKDHKEAIKEMCAAFAVETNKCHDERINDRAERVSEAVEGRKVLSDLTVATNRQTAVLNTIATRIKVEGA